jgi:hypothetical protein
MHQDWSENMDDPKLKKRPDRHRDLAFALRQGGAKAGRAR